MSGLSRVLRFLAVGAAVNILFYGLYLALAALGLHPLAAMTATYAGAVATGFLLNRRFTFPDFNPRDRAFLRYCAAYALGYALNFAALWLFASRLGLPHEAVQAAVVLSLPALLFVLQKRWVFAGQPSARPRRDAA